MLKISVLQRCLFLLNSDKRQYGSLVRDIVNEFTCNGDTYPRTLTSACDYIVKYRAPPVIGTTFE